jgi:hypothetical protein
MIIMYIGFLLRILLGPFTYEGVVAFHYGMRISVVSTLHMHAYKLGLSTLFILDFDRMVAVSETKVRVCMFVFTSFCTLVHLAQEAVTRNIRGLDHYSRLCFNTYLGKVVM